LEISVVHPSLNKTGGAERYCLEMINTLTNLGHTVNLYTIDKTDWIKLREKHNLTADPEKEHYLQEKTLTPDGLFSWIRTASAYMWLLIEGTEESEICINNYGEIMPFFAQVSVVHSVPMSSITENNYGIPLWKLIQRLYNYIYETMKPYHSEIIVTNSSYNAGRINHRGKKEIIYPPVKLPSSGQEEKNGEILTVARLKTGKNLSRVAEIASNSRNRFNVAGHSEYGSERLIKQLRDFKNIEVYVNPRRDKIIELMTRCSVYLSTQNDEAFGIAIVEAMSLGCIPLVYRGGGPWTDILVENEEYGLCYSTSDEAVEKIRMILMDETRRAKLRENGVIRAQAFTDNVFRQSFTDFMNRLEPREKQDHRIYKWYRKIKSIKEGVRERVSIRAPL